MDEGQLQPGRSPRIAFHQGLIWLQDKLGHYVEALVVLVFGLGLLLVKILLKGWQTGELLAILIHVVVTAAAVFFLRRAARDQAVLIEVTMSYLISGDRPVLDHLLGKLIGGKWHRREFKSGNALFDVLEAICRKRDVETWEIKRRIAEALPALSLVNARRALRLVEILRDDWDVRWKSDLRRRAVEGLIMPASKASLALIFKSKPTDIQPLLRLREGDEVFTAMAIAEALSDWESNYEEVGDIVRGLRNDLTDFSAHTYSQEENASIAALLELLEVARGGSVHNLAEKLEEASQSDNIYIRIIAARNVLRIASRLQEKTLEIISKLADPVQSKYVRRPIAKEQSVKFLIRMLREPACQAQAEALLLSLIDDEDQIIRVTTFDLSESLLGKNAELLCRICDQILSSEEGRPDKSLDLIERAAWIKQNLLTEGI